MRHNTRIGACVAAAFFTWAACGQDTLPKAPPDTARLSAVDTLPKAPPDSARLSAVDTLPKTSPDSARLSAFDTLAGALPQSVKKGKRPYLVTADIEVAPGATVVIEPGSVFLFKNFTTLHVHGTVLARAAKGRPIVFTSENDSAFNRRSGIVPAAYDWNGIMVYENGNGSSFWNCSIRYSLYGINSLTKFIRVEECAFLQNGKSDLTIEGKKYENVSSSFSYGAAAQDAVRLSPLARFALRWSGVTLFCAGAALSAWQAHEYPGASAHFDRVNDINDPDNKSNPDILSVRTEAKAKLDNTVFGIIGGAAIALCGAAGFGISFLF